MKSVQKIVRHTDLDIETACWELVRDMIDEVDGKEYKFLKDKLNMANVTLDTADKPGNVPWSKVI